MTTYGSVVRRPDGLFQLWYTTFNPKKKLTLAYAESRDGIGWERPGFETVKHRGKKTNIVFDQEAHGAAVIYDAADARPGWRYKMLTGAAPSGRISAFRSADGIAWLPAAENPVIGSNPDCPISFCRLPDGRIVAFHRPGFSDRRVGRTETPRFWANAAIGRGGWLRAEVLDLDGKPIPGFTMKDSVPAAGDSTGHALTWQGAPDAAGLAHREIRLRLHARNATLYSFSSGTPEERRRYWDFRIAGFLRMEQEKARM